MAAWGLVGLPAPRSARSAARRLGRVALALACALRRARGQGGHERLHVDARRQPHARRASGVVAGRRCRSTSPTGRELRSSASPSRPSCARLLARMRARMDVTLGAAAPPPRRGARTPARAGGPPAALLLALASRARARRSRLRDALGARRGAAAARARVVARARLPRRAPRTPTAASAARAGSPAASSTRPGRRSGLAAAGRNPLSVRRDGHSVLDALRGEASTPARRGRPRAHDPRAARLRRLGALARRGATSSREAAARPRARRLVRRTSVNLTAFAIFALRAAGHSAGDPPRSAARRGWLARQQNADGGFGFGARGGAQRRRRHRRGAAGARRRGRARRARARARASRFLRRAQNPDGGYPAAARRRIQRPVDRLGGPGADRGRARRRGASRAQAAARRSATWRACSRPTAACATRAPARRRRCG